MITRETWARVSDYTDVDPKVGLFDGYLYRTVALADDCCPGVKWRSSIHMPREAARLFLKVKSVRVERLWDITEEDARAEGVGCINGWLLDRSNKWCSYTVKAAKSQGKEIPRTANAIGGFACFWDSINLKRGYGWDKNPWVWVIEFEIASGM